MPNLRSDRPAETRDFFVELLGFEVAMENAVERGLEIAHPLRDEDWGVRRFMLREPSGTTVNVLSHRSD